ncbi:MAG: pyrE [Burkholderiales bacterium]|nr:pyrE [Burkholderiales bacterium]
MSSLMIEPDSRTDSKWKLRRQRLIRIVRRLCLLQGDRFRLASGNESTYYFNMKPAMFNAEGAYLISEFVLEEARKAGAELIGGLEMGAIPIIACSTQLSFTSSSLDISGFFVRKAAKNHGTRTLIEGLSAEASLKDKRALIVDDVTTTGHSVLQAVEAARAAGAVIGTVVTVVDRLEGAETNLAARGLGLVALTTARDYDIR